jgi:hypothetical protein
MWSRQEKRYISRACYDASGGIEGALAQRVETIFESLTEVGALPDHGAGDATGLPFSTTKVAIAFTTELPLLIAS